MVGLRNSSAIKANSSFEVGKLHLFAGYSKEQDKVVPILEFLDSSLQLNGDVVLCEDISQKKYKDINGIVNHVSYLSLDSNEQECGHVDVDRILEVAPDIVIVSDIVGFNSPGSRNLKRWQDIVDILESGVDVFAGFNVYEVESRKDDVENILGREVVDTVPDFLIENAHHIHIVDELPERLMTDTSFSLTQLMALRELLFKVAFEKLNHDRSCVVNSANKQNIWKTDERILLAIGHGPNSENLIRNAKQIADRLGAPWYALYVDTNRVLSDEAQNRITKNLDLSRELGARVIMISDHNLVRGIEKACLEYDISQLIIGQPRKKRFLQRIRGNRIFEKLNKLENDVTIHIVRPHSKPKIDKKKRQLAFLFSTTPRLLLVTLIVMTLGGFNAILHHSLDLLPYHSVGLLFLLQVTIIGMFFSVGLTVWSSVLASQVWNVFFIPPLFHLTIKSPDDFVLCISFIFIATIVGSLTSIIKRNQSLLKKQERKTNALYSLSAQIVESEGKEEVFEEVSSLLSSRFNGKVAFTLANKEGVLEFFKSGKDWFFNKPREWKVVEWCFEKNKIVGKWTDAFSHAGCICFPLTARGEVLGVLAYAPNEVNAKLSIDDREIMLTISSQIGLYLQRENFHEEAIENDKLRESEKLHQTLLNSVSHELNTPLTAISGIADTLSFKMYESSHRKTGGSEELIELSDNLRMSVSRLRLVVDNILDMSRLEGGVLRLKQEWTDLNDVVDNALDKMRSQLEGYEVLKVISDEFPLIYIDAMLMEQVFFNLVLNSYKYCPVGSKIMIKAVDSERSLKIFFSDNGPGVSSDIRNKIFDKFFRYEKSSGGTGLGLSIVRSIVEQHKGSVEVVPSDRGLKFQIILPRYQSPEIPKDKI